MGDTQCEKHPIEVCGAGCLFKEGEEECHDKVGLPKNTQPGKKVSSRRLKTPAIIRHFRTADARGIGRVSCPLFSSLMLAMPMTTSILQFSCLFLYLFARQKMIDVSVFSS